MGKLGESSSRLCAWDFVDVVYTSYQGSRIPWFHAYEKDLCVLCMNARWLVEFIEGEREEVGV